MATIIIGAILFIAMALAVRYVIKAHMAGKCVGCSGCNGHCEHCSEAVREEVHKV
jgi:hypothetical protein